MISEVVQYRIYDDIGSKIIERDVYYHEDTTSSLRNMVLWTFRIRGNFRHPIIINDSLRLSFYRKSFDRYLVTSRVLEEL
jgi:hypothetical protein